MSEQIKLPNNGNFAVSYFCGTEYEGINILETPDFEPGYILQLWEAKPNKYGLRFVGVFFNEDGSPIVDKSGLAGTIKFVRFIKEVRTSSFSQENSSEVTKQ